MEKTGVGIVAETARNRVRKEFESSHDVAGKLRVEIKNKSKRIKKLRYIRAHAKNAFSNIEWLTTSSNFSEFPQVMKVMMLLHHKKQKNYQNIQYYFRIFFSQLENSVW